MISTLSFQLLTLPCHCSSAAESSLGEEREGKVSTWLHVKDPKFIRTGDESIKLLAIMILQ